MSLRTRIFLSHALVITLALALAFVTLLVLLRDLPERQRQTQLAARAEDLVQAWQQGGAQPGAEPARLRAFASDFAAARRARVLTTDGSGRVTSDSASNARNAMTGQTLDLSRTQRDGTPGSGDPAIGVFRDPAGRRYLFAATPLGPAAGNWLALAQIAAEPRPLLGLLDDLSLSLARALLIALALATAVAALVARSIARPIREVARAARALADGDPGPRVQVSGPAEVRMLAGDFNRMTERVASARRTELEFIANLSHELRTPLTAISGFAQAIRDGDTPDPARAAAIVFEESARLQRMVTGLLDSAQLASGSAPMALAPVDVNALISSLLRTLHPRAGQAGIILSFTAAPDLPAARANADRLTQVLNNLADNALKHTPAGGRVSLATSAPPGWVEITVSDSGSGISEKDLPHIFERFYQADAARSGAAGRGAAAGAGLGLAIAKQIIEAHGGVIEAHSVPGIGSRLTVRLPASPPNP